MTVRYTKGRMNCEDFEAGQSSLNSFTNLVDGLGSSLQLIPSEDIVEGEVGIAMILEDLAPLLNNFHDRFLIRPVNWCEVKIACEVQDRRHAAKGSGPARHLRRRGYYFGTTPPLFWYGNTNMRVGLNAAREDDLTLRTDDSSGFRLKSAWHGNSHNLPVQDAHVHLSLFLRSYCQTP